MNKEKLNWWWFLLGAGIIIPFISFILAGTLPYYIFISHYFVTGLNPIVAYIPNFLITLIICLYYKLIKPKSLLYIIPGIIILILVNIGFFIKEDNHINNGLTRRYYDNATIAFTSDSEDWKKLFPNAFISILFLFFLVVNYSKKSK